MAEPQLDHIGIIVADMAAAKAFFSNVLQLQPSARLPEKDTGVERVFYDCGAIQLQLIQSTERLKPADLGRIEHLAFNVSDMDDTLSRLRDAGVEMPNEPTSVREQRHGRTILTYEGTGPTGIRLQLSGD